MNIPLRIKATDRTPMLEYNPKELTFSMVGVSVPDDAKSFYAPILSWVEGYVKNNITDQLTININLDYFSIQSASILLKIFKLFDTLPNVVVNWYFDDPDTEEIGLDLADMLRMKFNLIQKNPENYNEN